MKNQNLLWRALFGIAAIGALYSSTAAARTYVDVDIGIAPPPPRYEHIDHRAGYVWVPGYWAWNGHRHYWVNGYSVRQRHGYAYRPARWDRDGNHWRFRNGGWDRDHDGIDDRYERRHWH